MNLPFLRELFRYNKTERNGVLVLSVMLLLLIVWKVFSPWFYAWYHPTDEELATFHKGLRELRSYSRAKGGEKRWETVTWQDSSFVLDPNDLPRAQWKKLGLTKGQVEVIKNYESAGGHFYEPSDLKKVYSIPDGFYQQLKPHIRIETSEDRTAASDGKGKEQGAAGDRKEKEAVHYFAFDPDTLSFSGWQELGFSKDQARVIVNYREALGGFTRKEQVRKAYSVSEKKYERLEPYMEIASERSVPLDIDLAKADTNDLEALPGVGPVLAKRILEYGALLGGYHDPEQLHEVYGLRGGLVDTLIDEYDISARPKTVTKLDLSKTDVGKLAGHPYIDHDLAEKLIRVARQYEGVDEIDDLKRVGVLDGTLYQKLAPYLTISENEQH